ncbi:MAG: hypothetical protein U1F36_23445 [Planctomycetota bacterium]
MSDDATRERTTASWSRVAGPILAILLSWWPLAWCTEMAYRGAAMALAYGIQVLAISWLLGVLVAWSTRRWALFALCVLPLPLFFLGVPLAVSRWF